MSTQKFEGDPRDAAYLRTIARDIYAYIANARGEDYLRSAYNAWALSGGRSKDEKISEGIKIWFVKSAAMGVHFSPEDRIRIDQELEDIFQERYGDD